MEALSAFPESCLEEIMLTVLILSNLATMSGYPLGKKKKNEDNTQNLNLLHVRKWVVLLKGNLLYKTFFASLYDISSLTRWLSGKEGICQCRRHRRRGFDPWVRKIPWSRKLQPTPEFLPGEVHRQGILAGYSPWGSQRTDMTEPLSRHDTSVLALPDYMRRISLSTSQTDGQQGKMSSWFSCLEKVNT